ncbi:two-component system activity regulator YycH [Siminovitchia sp. FSL H7-0308]|uniref:Regulatory protein YycH of two-component signal transduction system YycFG n=1 Tax=Siminovitchia thermophila TaxID=1245522 RepID=A0ABS2RE16_9BACI|nr:two-component system activity regulator YycH [Siminovitchia thermophila]MBM7716836.1 regulatory protein YycH of two-component signal transduction system YycFG [Siminovitchia thermophila]
MNYENMKSFLLFFLVLTSVVLTWNLWTYQPKYEFSEEKNVHEVSISDPKDVADLIKPVGVLFHFQKDHYGTGKDEHIDQLLAELNGWTFYDFSDPVVYSPTQIRKLSESGENIEIIFPDLVPFDVYKRVLRFESNNLPYGAFNRIVIRLDSEKQEDGSVYFISTKDGKVYESHVNHDQLVSLFNHLEKSKTKYDAYQAYNLPDGRIKFLPSEQIEVPRYKYYSDYIEPESFKNALFKDPDYVRRDSITDGAKYTDGTSLMTVDYLTNMFFYVNPSQTINTRIKSEDMNVLERSINFVNEHAGWTDNYRYLSMDPYDKNIKFLLFIKGYPVFSQEGMTKMELTWGKEEIYQYERPYFILDIPLPAPKVVTLPSGKEAMDELLSNPDIKVDLIQEFIIGYGLVKDPENPKLLTLEPSWYYLYAGSWLRLDTEEIKGE